MPAPIHANLREALRSQYITGPHSMFPAHLEYFVQWYACSEIGITALLAIVLNAGPLDRLEYLFRGMDARVKTERLRQAAAEYRPLGPELDARLLHFQETIVPVRNQITHCWPYLDETSNVVAFLSAGRFGVDTKKNPKARRISLDDLMDHGIWLHAFASELLETVGRSEDGETLEIVDPTSSLPMAPPMDRPPKAPSARMRKRARRLGQTRD